MSQRKRLKFCEEREGRPRHWHKVKEIAKQGKESIILLSLIPNMKTKRTVKMLNKAEYQTTADKYMGNYSY